MMTRSRLLRRLLPGGAILLLLGSCANYSANRLEETAVFPLIVPEVATKTANLERLLKDGSRATASAEEQYSALPDDTPRGQTKTGSPQSGGDTIPVQALVIGKKQVASPEFVALARESFNRVHLDTSNPFTLLDAAALTVQFNRDIRTSYAQYQQSLGSLEIARGNFDFTMQAKWNFTPSYSFADIDSTNKTDTSLHSLGFSMLSRSGLQTDATVTFTGQDLFTNSGNSELGEGNIALVFSMPLLKEFGTLSTGAEEQANLLTLEGSLAAVVHQINASLKTISETYWDYSATVQNLLLSIEALERSKQTLRATSILVENELLESSSLYVLRADLSSKESSRQNSEQQLVAARNKMAIDLGFPVKIAHLLPMPTTNFSEIERDKACRIKANLPLLLKTALAKRQDYRQTELQMKSSQILEAKYRRDVLPDVNMVAGITHTGFTTDSAFSEMLTTTSDGDSAIKAGIEVSLPWTNDTARGQLRNQLGLSRERRLAYRSVGETIGSDINDNINALFYDVEILNSQELAEEQYDQATIAEFQKFKLGTSSILDVINVANSLTAARKNTVSARANLATAITNLRYSTGTLLNDSGQENKLFLENLITPLPPEIFNNLPETGTCN